MEMERERLKRENRGLEKERGKSEGNERENRVDREIRIQLSYQNH